jgi:F-type H+-transporting ATPase subunit b
MKRLVILFFLGLFTVALPGTRLVAAEEHSTAAAAGEVHGEAEPQLIPAPPAGLITSLTTLIVFLVLVAVLGKFAWAPIVDGLKKREDKIRKEIADAEQARAKAEATLKQYNQQLAEAENRVRELLNKATSDGERLATQIRMKAQQEAEEIKERSAKDLEAAAAAAKREIHEYTVDLSTNIAEKILKRNLNPDDQRELVRNSLEQLSSVAKN